MCVEDEISTKINKERPEEFSEATSFSAAFPTSSHTSVWNAKWQQVRCVLFYFFPLSVAHSERCWEKRKQARFLSVHSHGIDQLLGTTLKCLWLFFFFFLTVNTNSQCREEEGQKGQSSYLFYYMSSPVQTLLLPLCFIDINVHKCDKSFLNDI